MFWDNTDYYRHQEKMKQLENDRQKLAMERDKMFTWSSGPDESVTQQMFNSSMQILKMSERFNADTVSKASEIAIAVIDHYHSNYLVPVKANKTT